MGVLIEALTSAVGRSGPVREEVAPRRRHLGAWLANRLRIQSQCDSRLRVLERVRVAPRQTLVLVEVEGERLLVATSDGSASAIQPLSGPAQIRLEGYCA